MNSYELDESGTEWLLRKVGSSYLLKFQSKKEGVEFCEDFIKERGGILRIKEKSGIVSEKTYTVPV